VLEDISPELTSQVWDAPAYVDWLLPVLGSIGIIILLFYLWNIFRKSNQAGRISEFDEKGFRKIVKDEEESEKHSAPLCPECKLPMRKEIRYKDFLKDTGEFLITRESLQEITQSLVDCQRISKEDKKRILEFFESNPSSNQQTFRRYKCPNCSKVLVLPYRAN
jgi:hypothetical protein